MTVRTIRPSRNHEIARAFQARRSRLICCQVSGGRLCPSITGKKMKSALPGGEQVVTSSHPVQFRAISAGPAFAGVLQGLRQAAVR